MQGKRVDFSELLQGYFQINGDVTDVSQENAFFSEVQVHN